MNVEQFTMKKNYLLITMLLSDSQGYKLEYQQALCYVLDLMEKEAKQMGIKFNEHGCMIINEGDE